MKFLTFLSIIMITMTPASVVHAQTNGSGGNATRVSASLCNQAKVDNTAKQIIRDSFGSRAYIYAIHQHQTTNYCSMIVFTGSGYKTFNKNVCPYRIGGEIYIHWGSDACR